MHGVIQIECLAFYTMYTVPNSEQITYMESTKYGKYYYFGKQRKIHEICQKVLF